MSSEDELHRYFAERLPFRLDELEEAFAAARKAGWQSGPRNTFHRLAHSLAGAGATFGFPQVTSSARLLEDLAAAYLGTGAPPEDAVAEMAEILARLRAIAGPSLP